MRKCCNDELIVCLPKKSHSAWNESFDVHWKDHEGGQKRSQGRCQKTIVLSTAFYPLFSDPRKWSQEEVRQWLIWTSARHSLPIDPARFPMNGKSLCLMSLAMFSYRLPLGGKLLYKDFQLRLTAAFHIEDNLDRHHQKIIKIIHHWMSSFLVKTK